MTTGWRRPVAGPRQRRGSMGRPHVQRAVAFANRRQRGRSRIVSADGRT